MAHFHWSLEKKILRVYVIIAMKCKLLLFWESPNFSRMEFDDIYIYLSLRPCYLLFLIACHHIWFGLTDLDVLTIILTVWRGEEARRCVPERFDWPGTEM